eukprot:TRINITY_DN4662_c0_g3_i3.p3 TRINITY_DN4662_c0_g3~~TRINITY_DN4662_c0_g3_i3.p3  ORF type:complete len:146 (-),score=66.16 TRINITY_DN4662_c0_g3_i3:119-556(-)
MDSANKFCTDEEQGKERQRRDYSFFKIEGKRKNREARQVREIREVGRQGGEVRGKKGEFGKKRQQGRVGTFRDRTEVHSREIGERESGEGEAREREARKGTRTAATTATATTKTGKMGKRRKDEGEISRERRASQKNLFLCWKFH